MARWMSLSLFICTVLCPVLCCDWLTHYGHLSNQSLSLIKLMGSQVTIQESPVAFPNNLYRRIHKAEVDSQLAFIRDSFKLIKRLWLHLYRHDNPSLAPWDTTKTENFLMIIFRQHSELKRCVSTNRRTNSRLTRYYRTLERQSLRLEGDRFASWEMIRRETKLHLDQLHLLVASIRGRCGAASQQC